MERYDVQSVLGRNRIETAGDLAKCSRNRLLILKGVGRKIAQELDGLASTLRDQFQLVEATPLPEPLVPDYLLEPRALVDLRAPISSETLDQLVDAGIATDDEFARLPVYDYPNNVRRGIVRLEG